MVAITNDNNKIIPAPSTQARADHNNNGTTTNNKMMPALPTMAVPTMTTTMATPTTK